jgi:GNAT superfamily N-acetyltransferase/ABC-type lipoprotein export system ATPase subunit
MHLRVSTPIDETPRVLQVRGLFDLAPEKSSVVEWDIDVPLAAQPWRIGLVTGPSGCGKSTIARALFPPPALWLDALPDWPERQSVLDGFPQGMSVKEVTELLGAVGFSSPPAWLRPYRALSTGQRFRCDLARLLAVAQRTPLADASGSPGTAVCDEFTSVVDRTVAQVGSAAVARAVRSRGLRFVAVSCHDDVMDWLQPDWVLRPAEGIFTWRSLQRRPTITLETSRCGSQAWKLFAPHHYLSGALGSGATCFLATWDGRPVAFSAWLPFVGAGPLARREHRTVVLPDFQGVGIGSAVSDLIASMWKGLGYVARSTTTHPGFKKARLRSPHWRLARGPSLAGGRETGRFRSLRHAHTRLTTGWEYVGEPLPYRLARALLAE